MKAKVIKKFKDKHTGKIHNAGDVITISKDRFTEILIVGQLVEEVKEKAKKAAE